MKSVSKTFILLIVFNLVGWIAPQKTVAQRTVNFQVFYDNLSPYGDWIDNPDYGYIWIPDVSSRFVPYKTNGYWVFTNSGWTWVSNYSWGWAPFHYGRWLLDPYYGWFWVPGNDWSPAWVTWRRSEGYYGWASIRPGISITIAFGSGYRVPYNQWTFVRNRDFGRSNIYNYYVNQSSNITIINNSTVINNIRIDNSSRVKHHAGPDRIDVQRRTGRAIAPIILRETNKPSQNLSNNQLQIYRPKVEKTNNAGRKPVPSKVLRMKEVKPAVQRNDKTQELRGNQQVQQQQQQQLKKQRNEQQAKQQQAQQQRNNQQSQQQQIQKQRNEQQAKQQQAQQQRNNQQSQQQQIQKQINEQQAKQQRNNQQAKQQQAQERNNQQVQQQRAQQQQPNKQKSKDNMPNN